MKKLSISAILSIALGLIAVAQTTPVVPTSLPIGSKASLTAYANGQVARGYITHGGLTVLQSSGSVTYLEYQNSDIADLMKSLSVQVSSFDVANTSDAIYTWVSVMNKNWETLYSGYRNAPPEKVGGAWKLLSSPVRITLSDYIPITFKNVQYAQLVLRDPNGNIEVRQVRTGTDSLYFQTALAGWGSELLVTYNTGTGYATAAYSVSNDGKMIVPSNVSGATAAYIENQTNLNDSTIPAGNALSFAMMSGYNDQGTSASPLLHLKIGSARQLVLSATAFSTDVANRPYVKPTKFVFYQFSNGEKTNEFEAPAVGGLINVQLPAGTYEIVPDYGDIFESKELPPRDDYYGGGKG